MNTYTCKEIDELWDRYLDGSCTPEEEQQVEAHLEHCPACQHRLEQALAAQAALVPPVPSEPEPPSGGEQQRWMRRAKWRNRLGTIFNLFCAFILFSIVSGLLTGLLYGLGGSASTMNRLPKVLSAAVGMTTPNVNVNSGGINSGFYFNLSMDYSLTKRVGYSDQILGRIQGDMRFHLLQVNREWSGGAFKSNLFFQYPNVGEELTEEQLQYKAETEGEIWHALEMLPEGTVSELAFSLDDIYSLEEVYGMFEGYDMDIVWYAFDTGLEERVANLGSYLYDGNDLWGMSDRLMLEYADNNSLQVWGDGPAKEKAFLRALEELQQNERWVRKVVTKPHLQERIDYVNEHGVRSYGLVVTGPTKELLKLSEHPHVTNPALGETDWWNWYQPNFSSVQY